MSEQATPMPSEARTVSLGGGVSVAYPEPVDATATKMGRANRSKDTSPEVRLRSALHQAGLRFRKDYAVKTEGLRIRIDVAFTRQRIAVFLDGCFWHGCPQHATVPRANSHYWEPKLRMNQERDRRVDEALTDAGWRVIRIWEHEDVTAAALQLSAELGRGAVTNE